MLLWLVIIVSAVLGGLYLFREAKKTSDRNDDYDSRMAAKDKWFKKFIAVIVIIIVAIAVVGTTFMDIKQGYSVAVVDQWAQSVTSVSGPSYAFKMPWASAVYIYTATSYVEMWTDDTTGETGEFPALNVLSKDGLTIRVDIQISYKLDGGKVVPLYKNFPDLTWENSRITSIVRAVVRDVIGDFSAVQLSAFRESVGTKIEEEMYDALTTDSLLSDGILKDAVEIELRDIDLPESFQLAIAKTLEAQQALLQADFDRQTKVIQANATAQSNVIEAEGQKLASIIEAEGIAQAQLIKANATQQSLQLILTPYEDVDETQVVSLYLWLEGMKDLDIPVIIMSGDGVPLIQVPTSP